jgi:hypothetical protein
MKEKLITDGTGLQTDKKILFLPSNSVSDWLNIHYTLFQIKTSSEIIPFLYSP